MTSREIQRVEIRDGKEYVVTVIPEQKRRRRRKPLMTKAMARGIAVGKWLDAGPALLDQLESGKRKRRRKGRRKRKGDG